MQAAVSSSVEVAVGVKRKHQNSSRSAVVRETATPIELVRDNYFNKVCRCAADQCLGSEIMRASAGCWAESSTSWSRRLRLLLLLR
jgi:hypothetical protein